MRRCTNGESSRCGLESRELPGARLAVTKSWSAGGPFRTLGPSVVTAMALLAAVTTIGLGLAGAASTPSLRVSANYRLGSARSPARGHDAPGLAVDPANPRHVVEVDQDLLAGQCDYHVSFDGGRTWKGGHLRAPAGFPTPPCVGLSGAGYPHMDQSVAFGSGQNVYTVFDARQSRQRNVLDSVLVARSSDGGRHFAPAVVAASGPAQKTYHYVRAQLAVVPRSGGDLLYVSMWGFTRFTSKHNPQVLVTRSTDGGATWSIPTDAGVPTQKAIEPTQPVVSPDGSVHVGWRTSGPKGSAQHLMEANSTDGGATWHQVEVGPVTGTVRTDPKMAVGPRHGRLYLTYQYGSLQGETTGPNFGNPDIYLRHSTNGGATWSAPLRVNDDPPGRGVDHRSPHLSVAPDGRLDIVWFDRRNAHSPARKECNTGLTRPGLGDVYYASSSNGGVTVSANRRITDRMINWDVGFDCRIASSNLLGPVSAPLANSGVIFAWADSRDGNIYNENQDIFLARMTERPLAVTNITKASGPGLAVALSQLAYPGGAEAIGHNLDTFGGRPLGPVSVTKVVVANEGDTAGALAGAVLARASNGPLLVSPGSGLPAEVKKEVARIAPAGAYVIGGRASLSHAVVVDLRAAGVRGPVVRLAGADPADTARLVAEATVAEGRGQGIGAAPVHTAVIVDPTADAAAAASDLAASLRLPVLFVAANQVPAATSRALTALHISHTLVVGDSGSLSAAMVGRLPAPLRLAGSDSAATSAQVARHALGQLPHNVVYSVDPSQPVDAAVLGAATARLGGQLILASGAAQAERSLSVLGITPSVDRLVVVRQSGGSLWRWLGPLLGALVLLGGAASFLLTKRSARRRDAPAAATSQ
ncbi:MAG: cell wall-binding repeat-containing protein [Acidimicrobiales bacterium]